MLELLRSGELEPVHFQPPEPERGVRLSPDGMRRFLTAWERWWSQPVVVSGKQRPARDPVFAQAYQLARVLRDSAETYRTVPHEVWWRGDRQEDSAPAVEASTPLVEAPEAQQSL